MKNKRYWGNLSLTKLKEAYESTPGAVKEWNGETEIKIDAIEFDNGDIGLSVYNIANKDRIRVGSIKESKQ